jgi:septal ring factor EnvC (AmiA/AmiB activator)
MNASFSRKLAVALIICAVVGTEISYHFTLESRFDAIEEKLQQDTVAMQQMQDSLDTLESSKTATLSDLNKQLASLQSSFEPLGKTSQAQADTLTQLRQQITTLQQAQGGQQDAQKKLSDYLTQLEANVKKASAEAEAAAAKPAPVAPAPAAPAATTSSVPAPQPAPLPPSSASSSDLMSSPGAVSHPAVYVPLRAQPAKAVLTPTAPRADTAMDLRPADPTVNTDTSKALRALPVGALLPSKE